MENEVGIPIDSYIKEQFGIKPIDIKTYSPLTLAYIGDGIFDLVIRSIVVGKGNTKASRLHARTSQIVKAHSQAMMAEALEDVLTEEDGDYLGWQFGSSVFSANMHSLYTNTETLFSVPTLDLVEIIVDWIFGEK